MTLVPRIQEALREDGFAAWLLFDFRGANPIARSVLGMAAAPNAAKTTRRWFYLVPARGEPRKLVHGIEPHVLDHLPGAVATYTTWRDLETALAAMVASVSAETGAPDPAVAMEYSPSALLPYVSKVDAGTVELVRAAGARVVSSADLAQRFDGVLGPDARRDHVRTGRVLHEILGAAFAHVRERVLAARTGGAAPTEVSVQRFLRDACAARGLVSSDPPAVAVNEHAGDPHFATDPAQDRPIRDGDLLLIDLWAKRDAPGAVYADYTQVAHVGASVPDRRRAVFEAARDARDAAIALVRAAFASGRPVRGCDVDDAARSVVRDRGFGDRFVHRLGHSIGEDVHANGVHLDNLETHDERRLLDGTLVSVEPGIYLEDFGIRTEIDLLIDGGDVIVTTEPIQRELPALLA